jgi:hypothetical protein
MRKLASSVNTVPSARAIALSSPQLKRDIQSEFHAQVRFSASFPRQSHHFYLLRHSKSANDSALVVEPKTLTRYSSCYIFRRSRCHSSNTIDGYCSCTKCPRHLLTCVPRCSENSTRLVPCPLRIRPTCCPIHPITSRIFNGLSRRSWMGAVRLGFSGWHRLVGVIPRLSADSASFARRTTSNC